MGSSCLTGSICRMWSMGSSCSIGSVFIKHSSASTCSSNLIGRLFVCSAYRLSPTCIIFQAHFISGLSGLSGLFLSSCPLPRFLFSKFYHLLWPRVYIAKGSRRRRTNPDRNPKCGLVCDAGWTCAQVLTPELGSGSRSRRGQSWARRWESPNAEVGGEPAVLGAGGRATTPSACMW